MDFQIINHGSVISIIPLTEVCATWMNENVEGEHIVGKPTTGDWRMMDAIINDMAWDQGFDFLGMAEEPLNPLKMIVELASTCRMTPNRVILEIIHGCEDASLVEGFRLLSQSLRANGLYA